MATLVSPQDATDDARTIEDSLRIIGVRHIHKRNIVTPIIRDQRDPESRQNRHTFRLRSDGDRLTDRANSADRRTTRSGWSVGR